MHTRIALVGLVATAAAAPATSWAFFNRQPAVTNIELGPRPYYLVNDMDPGPLKDRLLSCSEKKDLKPTRFSIGHRGGACLQFPEESVQSIQAGTRMGAGIQECDVVFTKDRQLVCRHDQCDLHTTTNIVNTPLGAKCTQPFKPANGSTPASAKCCTSDITLAEYKTLCGKMDGSNSSATTAEAFLHGTPAFRTDLYAQCGTVLSHKEYIKLVDGLGLDFTPELKAPQVPMPFQGNYTLAMYEQQIVDEYRQAGIDFKRVWPQTFTFQDMQYWLKNEPEWAQQGVLLDESGDTDATFPDAVNNLTMYKSAGVQIVAPPLYYLVALNSTNDYVPSSYAIKAKELGLKIITWSLERSGPLKDGGDYYYTSIKNGTNNDGDIYKLVDVLAQQVGVMGIFSDWSSTVTYYANCFGLIF